MSTSGGQGPRIEIKLDSDFNKVSTDLQNLMNSFQRVSGTVTPLADAMSKAFSDDTLKNIGAMGEAMKGLAGGIGVLTERVKNLYRELGITAPALAGMVETANDQINEGQRTNRVQNPTANYGGGGGGYTPPPSNKPDALSPEMKRLLDLLPGGSGGPIGDALKNMKSAGSLGLGAGALVGGLMAAGRIGQDMASVQIARETRRMYGFNETLSGDSTKMLIQEYGQDVAGRGGRFAGSVLAPIGAGIVGGAAAGSIVPVLGTAAGAVIGGLGGAAIGIKNWAGFDSSERALKEQNNQMLAGMLGRTRAQMDAVSPLQTSLTASYGILQGRSAASNLYSDLLGWTGDEAHTAEMMQMMGSAGGVRLRNEPEMRARMRTFADMDRTSGTGAILRAGMGATGDFASVGGMRSVMGAFESRGLTDNIMGVSALSNVAGGIIGSNSVAFGTEAAQVGVANQVAAAGAYSKDRGFGSAQQMGDVGAQLPGINKTLYSNSFVQQKTIGELMKAGVPMEAIPAILGAGMTGGQSGMRLELEKANKDFGLKLDTDKIGKISASGLSSVDEMFGEGPSRDWKLKSLNAGNPTRALALGSALKDRGFIGAGSDIKHPGTTDRQDSQLANADMLKKIAEQITSSTTTFNTMLVQSSQKFLTDIAKAGSDFNANVNRKGSSSGATRNGQRQPE